MKGSTFFKRDFRDLRKTKELVPVARKIKLLNINREKNWAEYEYSHVILKLGRKNEFHRSASIFYYALIDFLFTIKRLLFHFAISYIKTLELVQQQQQQQVNVSVSHFVSLQPSAGPQKQRKVENPPHENRMGDAEAIAVDNGHVVFPRGGRDAIQQTFWTLGGFFGTFWGAIFWACSTVHAYALSKKPFGDIFWVIFSVYWIATQSHHLGGRPLPKDGTRRRRLVGARAAAAQETEDRAGHGHRLRLRIRSREGN